MITTCFDKVWEHYVRSVSSCERDGGESYSDKLVCAGEHKWEQMGKRCKEAGLGVSCARSQGKKRTDVEKKTRRESYFRRNQKYRRYRPYGPPAAEGDRSWEWEDLIARRASSRNRSSMSSSFQSIRKKQEPAWIRGRRRAAGKETGWEKEM